MLAFLFFFVSLAWGLVVFDFLDSRRLLKGLRVWLFALVLGVTLVGYAILATAVLAKDLDFALVAGLFLLLVGAIPVFWLKKDRQGWWHGLLQRTQAAWQDFNWPEFLVLAAIFAIFALVGIQSLLWDSEGFPQAILKGWGDGAYHLDMVQTLATSQPFTLTQPILAGKPLTYPFFVNFLTALFLKLGLPQLIAWHLPGLLFGLNMLLAMQSLAKAIFSRKGLALLFVLLVLMGAGLGFTQFFKDVQEQAVESGWLVSLKQNFQEPKYEYTHLDITTGGKPQEKLYPANIVWIVPLVSFFSHQRSFVLGAGLGFLILLGFWTYFFSPQKTGFGRWLWLLGFLALIHFHTLLALGVFFLVFGLREMLRTREARVVLEFSSGALVALILAAPALIFVAQGVMSETGAEPTFFVPWFGWMQCVHNQDWLRCDPGTGEDTDSNVLWFWLKNFGFVWLGWVFASAVTLFTQDKKEINELILPSWVLFIVPNVFLLQPWEFDNNKFIFWWWVLAALLSLSVFDAPPAQGEIRAKRITCNLALIVFVFFAVFSGALDVWARAKNGFAIKINATHFGYYGEAERSIAGWIKANTLPNDIFLTNFQATQFVPMLTGRPVYLGYPGWLWTQGKMELINERELKVAEFVRDGNAGKLCEDGVRYWLKDFQFFADYPYAGPSQNWRQAAETIFVSADGTREILLLRCR